MKFTDKIDRKINSKFYSDNNTQSVTINITKNNILNFYISMQKIFNGMLLFF